MGITSHQGGIHVQTHTGNPPGAFHILAHRLDVPAGAADNAQLTQREDPYFLQAQAQLQQRLKQTPNTNRAKNVILVVGDGMGFSTVTAARIFEGQQRGVDGESNVLAWEAFPIWRRPKPTPPTPKSPTPRPARWR